MSYVVGFNSPYKHITNTACVRAQPCNLQKRCSREVIKFTSCLSRVGGCDSQPTHASLSSRRRSEFTHNFVNYKKGALNSQLQVIKFTNCLLRVGGSDSQPQVIKFTSCLPRFGDSLRHPPPLKLIVMI